MGDRKLAKRCVLLYWHVEEQTSIDLFWTRCCFFSQSCTLSINRISSSTDLREPGKTFCIQMSGNIAGFMNMNEPVDLLEKVLGTRVN